MTSALCVTSECDNKWSIFVGLCAEFGAKHVSSSNELILARSGDSENNESWRNIAQLSPVCPVYTTINWCLHLTSE